MRYFTAPSISAFIFTIFGPIFATQAQPHYVEVGALPVPAAAERTELFEPQSRTWFSFPSYNQGNLAAVYKAAHTETGNLNWMQTSSFPGRTTYWGRGATDGKTVYFTGTIDNVSKYAAIQGDGTLGNWQDMASLPTPAGGTGRALHQAFVYSGRLYVIGGWHGDGVPAYADAYYAPILSSGAVGSFVQTTSLPAPVVGQSATVSPDGTVYIANFTNLFVGKISSDGSISSWANQGRIPGMNHNNYGNVGIALLPGRLVVVDTASTIICRLDGNSQVMGVESTIANPATFVQRSAYTVDGKVFVAATTGKMYRIDGIAPNMTWDDFTGGLNTWRVTADWAVKNPSLGGALLNADTKSDIYIWKTNVTLGTSWAVETKVQFNDYYHEGDTTGAVGFALGGTNCNLLSLSEVFCRRDGSIYPEIFFLTDAWNDALTNHPWVPGSTNQLILRLERQPGRNNLIFTIRSVNGLQLKYASKDFPDTVWNQAQHIGFRAFKVSAGFSYLSVETPLPPIVEIALYPGLTLRGEPGMKYQVEYTTPLAPAQWITVTNVTLSAPTTLWFDTNSTIHDQRFYRAVQQP